ncbi:transcriptional regulator [Cryobacterium sp. 1639]|uniref:transcriptional regulator n=1 Tax=Cryobacterium inferilacus TaxID=2866629 RepID=UPI001C72B821|nr:transcriptional regulator [Cryobacterium sp. 1639]MBX0299251.1 transcriptional regulator [Cryobacterium sp. 1639]
MTTAGLDPVIHPVKRLAAMSILANSHSVEYSYLRERLEISDSDLSKQMKALVDAGYVQTRKTGIGRGGSTIFAITALGRTAYTTYLDRLRGLLGGR